MSTCPATLRRCALALVVLLPVVTRAADHGDTPLLVAVTRHEARLTDLHVFTVGDRLVLSLCTNPAIPPSATAYRFPEDLTLRINVDKDSEVAQDDPEISAEFGGRIVHPGRISEDVTFEITFDASGAMRVRFVGLPGWARRHVRTWSGLADDPFIRGPRQGRNVAAVVIDLPTAAVLGRQSTILAWATSKVPEIGGSISEHAGRAIRSQEPGMLDMNQMRPRDHWNHLGLVPDVVIFDTARPAAFPNGRRLEDDVIDLTAVPALLASDAPFPTANDKPFSATFPYLAAPH